MKKYSKILLAFLAVNLNAVGQESDISSCCGSFAHSDVSISSQHPVIDDFQDIDDALEKSNNSKKKIDLFKSYLNKVHYFAEESLLMDLFNSQCVFFSPKDAELVESTIRNILEEEKKKERQVYLKNQDPNLNLSAKEEAIVFHKAIKNAKELLSKNGVIVNIRKKYQNIQPFYSIKVNKFTKNPEITVSLYPSKGSERLVFSNTICLDKDTISNSVFKAYCPDKEKLLTDRLEITFNRLDLYDKDRLLPALITLQFDIAEYNAKNGCQILDQRVSKEELYITEACEQEVVKILRDSKKLPSFLSCLKVIKPEFFIGTYFSRHHNLNPLDCLTNITFPKPNTFYLVYLLSCLRCELDDASVFDYNNSAQITYNMRSSISKLRGITMKDAFPFLTEYKNLCENIKKIESSYGDKEKNLRSNLNFLKKKEGKLSEEEKKHKKQLKEEINKFKKAKLSEYEKNKLDEHKRDIKKIEENEYKKKAISIANKTYSDAFTISEMTNIVARQKNINEDANRFINHEPLEYTKSVAVGQIDTVPTKKKTKKQGCWC